MKQLVFGLTCIMVAASASGQDIGYSSVEAAMAALQANKSVEFSRQSGWTIAYDKENKSTWAFAPFGNPAYPAVVKRMPVEKDGKLYLSTAALCGAKKQVCDSMMAEFVALDKKVKQDIERKRFAEFEPAARSASDDFLDAKSREDYSKAYSHFAAATRNVVPFDSWSNDSSASAKIKGPPVDRTLRKITWYENPPSAPEGLYVAVDYTARHTNADTVCGYLVWRKLDSGKFELIREESNHIPKDVEVKLSPSRLAEIRTQFRCDG